MNFLITLIFRFNSFLMNAIPLSLRWRYAMFLGWLWFDVLRIRRYTVIRNIYRVFPQMPKEEKLKLARTSMYNVCYNILEFLILAKQGDEFAKKVTFIGLEHYEKALSEKHGALLLSLHTGNGDMGISMLGQRGFKVHLIAKKMSSKIANDLLYGERAKFPGAYIDAHNPSNAFQIMGALKKNEGVIFVLDQFMGKPYGIKTTFFGRTTGTAYGLAVFALKTKSPVVPIYTYRDKNMNPVVEFEAPIVCDKKFADRDLQIQYMTQQYNHKIEDIIKKIPEQWMWLHKRWKVWE